MEKCNTYFTFYKSWKSATSPQDELNNYPWDMARLHHGRKHRGTRIAHLMFKKSNTKRIKSELTAFKTIPHSLKGCHQLQILIDFNVS